MHDETRAVCAVNHTGGHTIMTKATSNAERIRRLDKPVCVMLFETPRIATSGTFTIGVNAVPPMPPKLEIEKTSALHVIRRQLLVTRFFTHRVQFFR